MKKLFVVIAIGLLLGCVAAGVETQAKSERLISKEKVLIAGKESSKKKQSPSKKKSDKADSVLKGEKTFGNHCASCHAGGGNVVKPSRSIKGSATLATFATFRAYLNKPIGDMPHYEHLITNELMLRDLYEYTKTFDKEDKSSKKDQKDKKVKKAKSKKK